MTEELSDLELSGEPSDEEDIYNSLPRCYMQFEPEYTRRNCIILNLLHDIIHDVSKGFIQKNPSNASYKSLAFRNLISNFEDLREIKPH